MRHRFALGALTLAAAASSWAALPWSWRGTTDHQTPEEAWEDTEAADPALAAAAFARARARLDGARPTDDPQDPLTAAEGRDVWLCAYQPPAEPRCTAGDGPTLADAVDVAALGLGTGGDVLKLDLFLASSDAEWPEDSRPHEAGTYGFGVGRAVILPSEVLERGLYRSDEDDVDPTWDDDAVRDLLRSRGADVGEAFRFRRLRTASWVQLAADAPPTRTYRLHAWELPDAAAPEVLDAAARAAADHLAATVDAVGRIRYHWGTRLGAEVPGDNLVRHAGGIYSLVQASDAFGEPHLRDAAERAIGWMIEQSRTDERHGPHGGGRVRWLPEQSGSTVHLGGSALAAVAIATWQATTGDERWSEELREFALYLVSQQLESGELRSYAPVDPAAEPRNEATSFYPGEAVLGLVLTAAVDDDPRWLEAAIRGARWLVDVRDADRTASELDTDHWLMIALPRLHERDPDPGWLVAALRHADAIEWQAMAHEGHEVYHRDYAGGFAEPPRSTPATTRSEALAATLEICAAGGVACPHVQARLDRCLAHALQSQYVPEVLYWMPLPEQVAGGFAAGVVDPDVRDDFTQHALSALLGASRWSP